MSYSNMYNKSNTTQTHTTGTRLPEGEEAWRMGPVCPLCGEQVRDEGDTCDYQCYYLWWAHYESMVFNGVVILADDEVAPKLIHLQPWYGDHL